LHCWTREDIDEGSVWLWNVREREREREKGGSWFLGLGRCERFWVAGNCVEMEVTGSCTLVPRQCNVPVSARESNGIQQQQQQRQQVCNLGGSAFMGERVVHGFLKTGQCTSLKGKAQSRIRPKKQSLVVSSVLADFPMETVVSLRAYLSWPKPNCCCVCCSVQILRVLDLSIAQPSQLCSNLCNTNV
jgi:hypothetical protein